MARVAKALTDKEIKPKLRKHKVLAVGGVDGLILRQLTNAAGQVTSVRWYLRKQGAGKAMIPLGEYPRMSLAKAREEARRVLNALSEGVNPVREAKEKKAAAEIEDADKARRSLTVGDLLGEWMAYKVESGDWGKGDHAAAESVRRKEERRIRQNVPSLLGLSVADAEPKQIADALAPIWCSKRATADTICSHLIGFFRWAMTVKKCRAMGNNPAQKEWIKELLPSERKRNKEIHHPALDADQLPRFVRALLENGSPSALCTVMAILTCTRSANVRGMRWDQLNDDWTVWTIDAEEMKVTANGQHIIPLSDQAQAVLRCAREHSPYLDSMFVFNSDRNGGKPLSANTLNTLIHRMHAAEVSAGREGWIDREQTKKAKKAVIAVQHGISRATFKTWAVDTRQDDLAVELILHHEIDAAFHGSYNRADALEHKKAVLDAWGAFCFSESEGLI